jgi:cysteinyl-tRNA synthetase
LAVLLAALGLRAQEAATDEIPADIRALADERLQARANKDWAASDRLRDQLSALGWTVKDAKGSYELSKSAS